MASLMTIYFAPRVRCVYVRMTLALGVWPKIFSPLNYAFAHRKPPEFNKYFVVCCTNSKINFQISMGHSVMNEFVDEMLVFSLKIDRARGGGGDSIRIAYTETACAR